MAEPEAPPTELVAEGARMARICNACRYCEGYCAVFPALERRLDFTAGDLSYLANLCHSCGACYVDCQFSPPHEFDVNVPRVLAELRNDSYAAYAWPRALAPARSARATAACGRRIRAVRSASAYATARSYPNPTCSGRCASEESAKDAPASTHISAKACDG